MADWSSLLLQYPYPVLLTVKVREALQVQVTDLKLPVLNAAAPSPVTGMDDVVNTSLCDCFKRLGSGLSLSMFQTYFNRLFFHVKKRICETCCTTFPSNINTSHSPSHSLAIWGEVPHTKSM